MSVFLIVVSSLLALISPLIYARAILRGEARPHRTTRLVLLIITILSTASLFANGDRVAVWLASVSALQSIIVFSLSLKYGVGGWAKIDLGCLAVALAGIITWQLTDNPLFGLYFSIAADFIGMVPTLIKTYHSPKTEIVAFFALDCLASICSLFALKAYAIDDFAYPLYLFLINLAMSLLIAWPRKLVLSEKSVR
jgi:hypothetical protein